MKLNKIMLSLSLLLIFTGLFIVGVSQYTYSIENETEHHVNINMQDVDVEEVIKDEETEDNMNTELMDILLVNSIFENVPMRNIDIVVNYIGINSFLDNRTFTSNNKGRLTVLYNENMSDIDRIQITLPNNQRFFFNTVDFAYPSEVPEEYILKINDKLISNYVTTEEQQVFNRNTIVMKEYFSGKDMNDRDAWEYLLRDETLEYHVQKLLEEENQTMDQFIEEIFLDINNDRRKSLWGQFNDRIENGVKNYMNMLNSGDFRKNVVSINFFNVKAFDNPYTSYLTAGAFEIRQLNELNSSIDSLEKWKRESGRERGYVFYDKNIYYNIHIKKIDPQLYR